MGGKAGQQASLYYPALRQAAHCRLLRTAAAALGKPNGLLRFKASARCCARVHVALILKGAE